MAGSLLGHGGEGGVGGLQGQEVVLKFVSEREKGIRKNLIPSIDFFALLKVL